MQERKRVEKDSLGEIEVPDYLYYGAQTARSLLHFNIGQDKMAHSFIKNYGLLKGAAALVNSELGLILKEKAKFIIQAAREVFEGKLEEHFPLSVWQTGSGTQTNMNVNEVIAHRAWLLSDKTVPFHPNDEVNKSQSSNDTFPTVMHMTAVVELRNLLPIVCQLYKELKIKEEAFAGIIKIGRTHLMDALPMTLGQQFSGYAAQIEADRERIESSLPALYELAIGGTAIGTGFLAPPLFGEKVAERLAEETGHPFVVAKNHFSAMAAHDALVFASSALKTLAISLIKIATDLSFMGSGPRCGLGEITFPENEPGSSIMPGKVNPTQCEALLMICTQVIGNDLAISLAGSRGNFELNVFKPLIIHNFLHSVTLLTDGLRSFISFFLKGISANKEQLRGFVERSLMVVTALVPTLGYDRAAQIALKAYHENLTLKEAALQLGFLTEKEWGERIHPEEMC